MFVHEHQVRIRYSETDRMGYCYYGNYAQFYEVGRVEALRSLGYTYKELEDEGILLPAMEYNIKYLKPAHYDDLLTVKTMIKELPAARITFEYEMYNEGGERINIGTVHLVFVEKGTGRPRRAPDGLIAEIEKHL